LPETVKLEKVYESLFARYQGIFCIFVFCACFERSEDCYSTELGQEMSTKEFNVMKWCVWKALRFWTFL